ncbi:YjcQ family protein [Clostridium sp.]|uniref:YjcQ family protein n=1 Tax=Clostridium sp. TaxID=1506 RepID=UPI002617E876|nr:YjcQ family protein [Clostridium sp.]
MEKKLYKLLILIQEAEEDVLSGVTPNITPEKLDLESNEALGRLVLKAENMNLIKTDYSKGRGIPAVIYWKDTILTEEGLKYLEEKSELNKVYNTIKKVVDLIP